MGMMLRRRYRLEKELEVKSPKQVKSAEKKAKGKKPAPKQEPKKEAPKPEPKKEVDNGPNESAKN